MNANSAKPTKPGIWRRTWSSPWTMTWAVVASTCGACGLLLAVYGLHAVWAAGLLALIGAGVFIAHRVETRARRYIQQQAAALAEREAALRAVSDSLPDSYVYRYTQTSDGTPRFLHLSAGAERIHERPVAEMLEDSTLLHGQIAADQLPVLAAKERESLKGLTDFGMELQITPRSGVPRWLHVRSHPRRQPDGRVVWDGVATDVTARRQTEQALRASRAQLELFIEHAPAALAMFDREMRYLAVSRRWLTDYHLTGQTVIGRSHYEVFPEIGETWKAVHRRALAGETVRAEQDPFERADGTVQWLRWEVRPWIATDGAIGGIVVVSEDISTRVRAEQAVREAKAVFSSLVDQMPAGVYRKDAGGRLLFVNNYFLEMTGRRREDFLGKRMEEVAGLVAAGPESSPGGAPRLAIAQEPVSHHDQILQTGERVRVEEEWMQPDGSRRHYLVVKSPVFDAGHRIVGTQGVLIDITALKQSEAALRKSEELFRTLVMLSPDAVFINQAGRVVFMNARGLALWRAKGETDVLGRSPLELIHPDSQELVRKRIKSLQDGGGVAPVQELKIRTVDGTAIDVETTAARLEFHGQPAIQVVVRDITERKRAEAALRIQQAILEETGRIAKVGGWELDVATGRGSWTDEVVRIHDLEPGMKPTREMGLSFYTWESRARIGAALERAIGRAEPYDLELEMISAKGVHKWVRTIGHPHREAGRVVRLQGSFQDITDQKQTERQLRLQAELGRVLTEAKSWPEAIGSILATLGNGGDWQFGAVWSPDPASGRLRSAASWTQPGRLLPELVEATARWSFGIGEGLPGIVWQRKKAVLFSDVAGELAYWRRGEAAQAGLRAAFGFPVMVEGRVVSVVDFLAADPPEMTLAREAMFEALGRQIGLFFQRCEAEDRVRNLNAELEGRVEQRTAQLAAANRELEAFSYSVSHDLRAPLRAVAGFSRALQEDFGPQLPPEARRYVEHVLRGAEQMRRLIEDLLALSRLGRLPLAKETVDTAALVQEVLAELAPACAGRELEVQQGQLPPCEGDRTLLRQVWFNLIENAVKYTRRRAGAAVIAIGAVEAPTEHVFQVRDNGAGFDPRYADKLFGVFQRLHRAEDFEGTGIGLAIVKRIVERHGGRVWAESAPEHGATFFFALPRNTPSLPGA